MAGVILGSAPLQLPFAQVLHRYMSASSGIFDIIPNPTRKLFSLKKN